MPNLVDEMAALYHRFGVRFFVFNDDEWFPPGLARYERVAALEAELERRRLEVIMSIKCRADDVEPDLFRRLLGMGVVRAYVGVESGSDHSLQTLNKHTTVAQNRRALEVLHQVGMLADFGLIIFDPDSTVEDLRANLDFLREMGGAGLAPLSFGRMEVYAGTPILQRLQREGRLAGNYMAWNYTIPDPRVEMLWRLMIASMRRRQYENLGLAKQCSIAYYELMMVKYLHADRYDPALGKALQDIVARVNNHSLAIFEEMFDFTLHDDVHNTALVNAQAAAWASRINLFDLEAVIFFFGGTSASCRLTPPVVCDPAPPPSVTPMICDPPPMPSSTPPPEAVPTITVAPGQHFTGQVVQTASNSQRAGAAIKGTLVDQYGQPLGGLSVTVERDGWQARAVSDGAGAFSFELPEAGTYTLAIEGDEADALTLKLEQYDEVTVEWVESWEGSLVPLPLAEVRTVEIVRENGLAFAADTPWPGARYGWSVSGGTLVEKGERVVWQPPAEAGRYLLQVVADWGRTGLAVDAAILVVERDGSVTVG